MAPVKNKGPLYVSNIKTLAEKLINEGPVRTESTPRRIRILYGGVYVADSTSAIHVWEHPYYPQLYLPWAAFESAGKLKIEPGEHIKDSNGEVGATLYSITLDAKRCERVIGFAADYQGKSKPLGGYVRVEFDEMDHWYEEDTEIFVHPKDPFKRVDVLSSSRPIEVKILGNTVAQASHSCHLYETSLPCRYYLPPTAVDAALLRPSSLKTKCPYKGEAEYYDVVLPNGQEFNDIIWYYRNPILECAAVRGMYCFYNEKVEIWVDGVKEDKPKTHFG